MGKIFCTNCGATLNEGSIFCPKCGTKLLSSGVLYEKHETPLVKQTQKSNHESLLQEKQVQALLSKEKSFLYEYVNMWKNYLNFTARTTRKGYWLAHLFSVIISLMLWYIPVYTWFVIPTFLSMYYMATFLPLLTISIRRLRDAGKHWANIFWNFLPLVGNIIFVIFLCLPSAPEDGRPVV